MSETGKKRQKTCGKVKVPNPGVACSNTLGWFKVDSAFHPFDVDNITNTVTNLVLTGSFAAIMLRYSDKIIKFRNTS